ncbi:MAG TPA: L,D-transpeptidase [Acidimicrobiales bacterium]
MRFQLVHNIATTGSMDGTTWNALVLASRRHQGDPSTYNFVYVNKTLPEKAKLYANGKLIFTALVNTGLPGADTANGTFPVYLRYTTTTMSGTNLDGSHYSDPGIPWVSYFNGGDALHGFIRSSYGYPQSLGCVEMTFNSAATMWSRTSIGTLVSVQ